MGTGTETSVSEKSDRNKPSQHLHLHRDVPRDRPDRQHRLNEDDGLRCPFHGVHDLSPRRSIRQCSAALIGSCDHAPFHCSR